MNKSTIRIRGRDYTVERFERAKPQPGTDTEIAYRLHGTRGAAYETLRNVPRPEMMFLIHSNRFGPASVMRNVWLTDKSGDLAVAKQ